MVDNAEALMKKLFQKKAEEDKKNKEADIKNVDEDFDDGFDDDLDEDEQDNDELEEEKPQPKPEPRKVEKKVERKEEKVEKKESVKEEAQEPSQDDVIASEVVVLQNNGIFRRELLSTLHEQNKLLEVICQALIDNIKK